MATLESLDYPSISSIPKPEALEIIKAIRLSRRIPVKKPKKKTTATSRAKKATKVAINNIDPQMAAELLKMIGG